MMGSSKSSPETVVSKRFQISLGPFHENELRALEDSSGVPATSYIKRKIEEWIEGPEFRDLLARTKQHQDSQPDSPPSDADEQGS